MAASMIDDQTRFPTHGTLGRLMDQYLKISLVSAVPKADVVIGQVGDVELRKFMELSAIEEKCSVNAKLIQVFSYGALMPTFDGRYLTVSARSASHMLETLDDGACRAFSVRMRQPVVADAIDMFSEMLVMRNASTPAERLRLLGNATAYLMLYANDR